MTYQLSFGKEYGQCVECSRVFIIDQYALAGFCNYDRSSLVKVGREYPSGNIPKGDRVYG